MVSYHCITMKRFNIRVYGIAYNSRGQVLLTDEFRMGFHMTKFPGGGLEWGEGLREALIREFMEETGQAVDVLEHVYINDFLQLSAFRQDEQIIAAYYTVDLPEAGSIPHDEHFRFRTDLQEGAQAFRWVSPHDLSETDLTFPIDKVVLALLKAQKSSEFNNQPGVD